MAEMVQMAAMGRMAIEETEAGLIRPMQPEAMQKYMERPEIKAQDDQIKVQGREDHRVSTRRRSTRS